MYYAILSQRALISLSGDDTEPFLQGLITNDIHKLQAGAAMYAALLTPQGKFLHDFFLYRRDGAILIDCDRARLPDLLARLQLYKLRSKVDIKPLPESESVIAAWGERAADVESADPRLPALGYRLIGKDDTRDWQKTGPDAYDRMRLELGVPDGAQDMVPEKTLLLEVGFEQLHGVDFNKGCYVGQEVTARSKHRAQLRKRLYQVRSSGDELPPAGTVVMAGDAEAGQLRSHARDIGLAILRVEEVEKAAGLRAGDIEITASPPAWMSAGTE